ncbi:hypothetical protein DNTS_009820 [Danionella cerebrum]|uniref:Platelet-derived growth factor (PDGF) family profile domain-containing protein n=1 Tax=Danionella cerebrum TaxID=2873325 RepID=A0A553MXK7_9TELE|nr:hypothetical protein DNTS_009820 [Danionella translucida]
MRESNPQLLDMKSIGALLICFPLLQSFREALGSLAKHNPVLSSDVQLSRSLTLSDELTKVALFFKQVCTVQGKTGSRVLLFPEAWALSQCRTLDVSVPVLQEFPSLVQYIYSPGCVPLRRCSGCCRDELLQCLPSSTRNVSIQLLRIDPAERSREYVVLSFLEHQRCECRPRRQHLRLQQSQKEAKGEAQEEEKEEERKKGSRLTNCIWEAKLLNGFIINL